MSRDSDEPSLINVILVIWVAFGISVAVNMVLPYTGLFPLGGGEAPVGILEPLFLGLSGICLAMGGMIVRIIMSAKASRFQNLSNENLADVFGIYLAAFILRMAFLEVPVILGLILAIISGEAWKVLPLGLASVVAWILAKPSMSQLQHLIEDVKSQSS